MGLKLKKEGSRDGRCACGWVAGVDGKSDSSDGYIDGCCKKAGGGDRRWRGG